MTRGARLPAGDREWASSQRFQKCTLRYIYRYKLIFETISIDSKGWDMLPYPFLEISLHYSRVSKSQLIPPSLHPSIRPFRTASQVKPAQRYGKFLAQGNHIAIRSEYSCTSTMPPPWKKKNKLSVFRILSFIRHAYTIHLSTHCIACTYSLTPSSRHPDQNKLTVVGPYRKEQ
jgi:hypothetical protein